MYPLVTAHEGGMEGDEDSVRDRIYLSYMSTYFFKLDLIPKYVFKVASVSYER